MKLNQISYKSYILRFWREAGAEETPWRIVLVNPQTGERRTFTEVDQLTAFINEHIEEVESQ